ncbi:MAG: flagellar M-ring protein FliF, partial [Pygmaiobacter massiliensis]|nr:flagellar M-ring protein FliF [Pygmaiobacter massiliensis]
ISILTLPFYEANTPGLLPSNPILPANAIYIAAVAGGAIFLLLLLLLVLRRRQKRKKTAPPQPVAYPEVAPVAEGADITNMRSEKSMELRRDVRDFANNNPEIAAQMVKGWLKGEEENG